MKVYRQLVARPSILNWFFLLLLSGNELRLCSSSEEIVLFDLHREPVFGLALCGRRELSELCVALWVVHALLEQVQFGFAYAQLSVHFEKALARVVKGLQAHGLKLQVLRVATEQVKRFGLGLLGVALGHVGGGPFVFVANDLLSALVEVHVEEDHLLDGGHVEHAFQVEINFVTSMGVGKMI